MKKENRLFVSLYSEDDFNGVTIPLEMNNVINYLWLNSLDTIDQIFDDYDDYRDHEVEMSSYAKDGSRGTTDVESIEELKSIFYGNDRVLDDIKKYEQLTPANNEN